MKVIFPEAISKLVSTRGGARRGIEFNSGEAAEMLPKQLGRRWSSYTALSEVRKKVMRQFWARSKNLSEQESRLVDFFQDTEQPEIEKLVKELAKSHAYENTVILAFIENMKKKSSVIKSTDFQWVRDFDHEMWLMINNIGRPRASPLIVGAFQHFEYEKSIKAASVETYFQNATLFITGKRPVKLAI